MRYTVQILIILVAIFSQVNSFAQLPDAEGSLVKWMSLDSALAKYKAQPKPILVDFYTSWCGWCKHMMKTTYADPGLSQYINSYFYPAKFNAEGKDTIEFLGKKYGPSSPAPRSAHELTLKFLKDQLMYPSTLFLSNYDKDKNEFVLSMRATGSLDKQKIEPMLVYTVENVFRNTPYDEFEKQFQKAFYDSTLDDRLKKLKWVDLKEVIAMPEPHKKKLMIFIHADWCNACKVMKRSSFIDSSVVDYLVEKYELVEFNAQSKDTIFFKGKMYVNPGTSQEPFHQLAVAMSRNNTVFPTLTVLDEFMKPVDAIPYYIHPAFLEDIAHYYGEEAYKTKSWDLFVNDRRHDQKLKVK